ncbi:MAG: hypothetical protein OSJ61_00365 [Lachnospiraceae bacterium]|nr:hypothetical protein [Lachnospiraceae bacterium]
MQEIYRDGNAVVIISDECCVTSQKEIDYILKRYSTIVAELKAKQLSMKEEEEKTMDG